MLENSRIRHSPQMFRFIRSSSSQCVSPAPDSAIVQEKPVFVSPDAKMQAQSLPRLRSRVVIDHASFLDKSTCLRICT